MLWMKGLGTGRLLVILGVSLFDDLCPFCCCRFVTGIEFREESLLINSKCPLWAQKGMVFNVNVGFAGLSNPLADDQAGRSYALFVGDTVLVGEVGRDLGVECGRGAGGRGGILEGYWRGAGGRGGMLEEYRRGAGGRGGMLEEYRRGAGGRGGMLEEYRRGAGGRGGMLEEYRRGAGGRGGMLEENRRGAGGMVCCSLT